MTETTSRPDESARVDPSFWPWPVPQAASSPAPIWAVVAAGVAGLLAALLLPGAPSPGINLLICGVAVAVPAGGLAFQRGRAAGRRYPVDPVALFLGAVSVGLVSVAAVRASEWLVAGCALAAVCLGAAAALDVRRWSAVLSTVPLFAVVTLWALPWAVRTVPVHKTRLPPRPWLSGIAIGGFCTLLVGGLLTSADAAFADLVDLLWPSFDLGLFPARVAAFAAVTAVALGAMYAVSTRVVDLPGPRAKVARQAAEWLIPLVLVTVTIAAFLAVEATMLFGGAEVVSPGSALSHAERARQGFGQLTVVTVIVLILLAWAGRAAEAGPPRHRRWLGGVGGTLLLLALLLGASALRRLWLYQDAYGWTVTRFNAGAFELWVAVVLIGTAVGWLVRRSDLLPRLVIGSAGLGLLVVGLAGPDAVVAAANVDRFEHGATIDRVYLSLLSEDAVPALNRLPEPERSCVLQDRAVADDPWYAWNLSRSQADRVLRDRPPGFCDNLFGGSS